MALPEAYGGVGGGPHSLLAMQTRLQMLEPHVDRWSQALALRTLPTNLPNTLKAAHALSETLLDACGEEAQVRRASAPHVLPHRHVVLPRAERLDEPLPRKVRERAARALAR